MNGFLKFKCRAFCFRNWIKIFKNSLTTGFFCVLWCDPSYWWCRTIFSLVIFTTSSDPSNSFGFSQILIAILGQLAFVPSTHPQHLRFILTNTFTKVKPNQKTFVCCDAQKYEHRLTEVYCQIESPFVHISIKDHKQWRNVHFVYK